MPVNAGKRHFWEYCPCRYLPVNTGGKYRWQIPVANTAGKCHRPTLDSTWLYIYNYIFLYGLCFRNKHIMNEMKCIACRIE